MSPRRILKGRASRGTAFTYGAVFLAVTAVALGLLAAKPTLQTMLRPGSTIEAEFATNYHSKLHANETDVKVAGIEVGVVRDVARTERGTVLLSLKVSDDALAVLGSEPTARVTPKTVLGGEYSIELRTGGKPGAFTAESIPLERTSTPVELDRLLEALPAPTRKSLRRVVANFDSTLDRGGSDALRELVAESPDTLRPAADVLRAARGTRPEQDLTELVTNLKATAQALRGRDEQLAEIVGSLSDATDALGDEAGPLADTLAALPSVLDTTRAGMADLRGSLDKATSTAREFRPAARELDPLLKELNPVLAQARPLLRDLTPLLADARPAVDDLVPVAERGTEVLEDLRGPVLDRVNGPILHKINNTWRGSGPYSDSGGGMQGDHKLYEELAYMIVNLDRSSKTQDAQGSLLGFQAGIGTNSLAGVPFTAPNLLEMIKKYAGGAR